MKFVQAYVSVGLAIAASLVFFAGASAFAVTYTPQVPIEAVANAHDRGYLLVMLGVLGFVVTVALAGHNFHRTPKTAITALAICGISLLFPMALVLFL